MNATDLFKAGRLQLAIDAQIQEVKAKPADHGRRLFLFELCAFAGDLERARRQIDALQFDQPELVLATKNYRDCLDAEDYRRKVFRDGVMPQFFGQPPQHLYKRLEAVNALRANKQADALALIGEADKEAPPPSGKLNDKPFTSLRDYDELFGPVLEVMSHGAYYWLPLEQIEFLGMKEPQFPRDLIWFPAKLSIKDGPTGDAFLPALYPGTHEATDEQMKLGNITDWKEQEGGPILGIGRHTFKMDDKTISLLDWRELEIGSEASGTT
jgi:type VI secretion system protein ImpE